MDTDKLYISELKNSIAWTAGLTALFILFNWSIEVLWAVLLALPVFIVLYFLLFSIGKEQVSTRFRTWLSNDIKKVVVFPAVLIFLYFGYVYLTGQNPFQGAVSMVPYLLFFPVLVFAAGRRDQKKIDWLDFTTFVIFLLPITLIDAKPAGNLPESGNDFDSVYRIVMMLTAVYAFVVVRGLDDAGFFPEFSLKKLFTAMWVWLAFYGFVFIIGYSVDFIKFAGHETRNAELLSKITLALITTFLHTALFEELFFRGILQNLLAKRIGQSAGWAVFWRWGFGILLLLALLVGYTLDGNWQWCPAAVTAAMFLAAFYIERSGVFAHGVYTSLAITGVIFGLVHYHSGSIIYIGFACIAGWAYGYTWIKTKNVFYAALVHALVGTSTLIFGLELMK